MQWNHILDKQPENESIIIQIDAPYESYKGDFKNHYTMGMRQYKAYCTWEEYMKWCDINDIHPNFWWLYAKDFSFPNQPERSKREDTGNSDAVL